MGDTMNCPRCNSRMHVRTALVGENRGNKFWGCSRYPYCKGTRPYNENYDYENHNYENNRHHKGICKNCDEFESNDLGSGYCFILNRNVTEDMYCMADFE